VLQGASSSDVSFTVKNTGDVSTGAVTMSLTGSGAANFGITADTCSGNSLGAGGTCTLSVHFQPGARGPLSATLLASSTMGGSDSASLTGVGLGPALLAVTPSTQNYGSHVLSSTTDASFTVKNTGDVSSGAPSVTLTGSTDYTIFSNNCTTPLAASATCTVVVRFKPSTAALISGNLSVSATPGGTVMVPLSGTGITPGQLSISPNSNSYTSTLVGNSTSDVTFTISNQGGASTGTLTVSITGSDSGQFSASSDTCSGMSLAAMGSPGSSCTIKVRFSPTSAGAKNASLTATSTMAGSNAAALSGTGLAPAQLALSPPSQSFGSVVTSQLSADFVFTVKNVGDVSSGTVSVSLGGVDAAQWQLKSTTCGPALAAGGTCTATLNFAPTTSGAKNGALNASATPGGGAMSTLTGTGLKPAALSFSPPSNNFGTITVGMQSANAILTVTNTGDQATSAITTGGTGSTGDFNLVSDNCNGQTLAGGASCTLTIAFKPTSYGQKTMTGTVSATTGGNANTSLTGVGQDTVTLTVTINGTGSGTVSGAGLTCIGSTCTGSYLRDTNVPTVSVSETPAASSIFGGWGGACGGTMNPCGITMNGSASVSLTATFTIQTFVLSLTVTHTGAAAGYVTSSPAGIDCGTAAPHTICSASFNYDTNPLTLTEHATGSNSFFTGWGGDCSGTSNTCNLVMTQPHSATANYNPANYMFLTAATTNGNFGGLAGADTLCANAATAAVLPGTFKALLATSTVSALSRLGTARGWVRPDGKPFADASNTLFGPGVIYYPPRISAANTDLGPNTGNVWTGTDAYGNIPSGGTTATCGDWTNGTTGVGQSGNGNMGTGGWAYQNNQGCATALRLYCFGVDYNTPLTFPKDTGQIIFVSNGYNTLPTGMGIAGFDGKCNNDAMMAGLPGSYAAVVSTSTASASSRFSFDPTFHIVRPDGVTVATSFANFFSITNHLAQANLEANGSYLDLYSAWTGSTDPNVAGTLNSTCQDWMSKAAGPPAGTGGYTTGSGGNWWSDPGATHNCDWSIGHVYCLQR
jgi:hypothetical protein